MAEPQHRTTMPAPSLGVNNSDDIFSVLSNQVYRAVNCHLSESGILYTRGGCRTLNTTALDGAVTSIYDYWRPEGGGQQQIILVTAGSYLYRWNSDLSLFESVKELSSTDRPMWCTFYDGSGHSNAIMCNGTDFFRYDGDACTDIDFISGMAKPRYILPYDDRLLVAGMDDYPYRAYVSDTLDCTTWAWDDPSVNHYWGVGSASGNRITGLAQIYNFAAIFQKDAVSIITEADTTSSTSEIITVSFNYGSTSQWSIQTVGNVIYFADENHLYRGILRQAIENGLEVIPIDRNIRRKYKTVRDFDDIISVYNKSTDEIYFGVQCKVGTKKDTALIYSTELSGQKVEMGWVDIWSGWWENGASFNPNTLSVVLDSDRIPVIWRGDSSGYVYAHEEMTKQGMYKQYKDYNASTVADIKTEIVTGTVAPSGISVTKKLIHYTPLISQFTNESTYIEWLIDGSYIMPKTQRNLTLQNTIPFWGNSTWDGTVWTNNAYIVKPVTAMEPFRYLQIIIQNDGNNARDNLRYGGGEILYQVRTIIRQQG